ncbi:MULTISPECIES: hypothetical protein [Chryseobacterium]|uniref:Uncharacterized protein n=1 Tax=Chryseobacterium candidae TaxID=1978493 RepID=A0ABY2R6C2_9FLAO|nr:MULTISPECIES: hypothetical protein [Chryseobacterium]THV58936.1 hypothetical protein EK417_11240 [Chryseobacterium candidae]SIR56045.1 hypothetical protein SAMN05880573_12721 [Chryseobacterium sp. RU33C]
MKTLFSPVFLFFSTLLFSQVGINTESPDASSNLTVAPTDRKTPAGYKGTLLSAMSSANRLQIASPATGLLVYDTDQRCLMSNNGTPAAPVWACTNVGSPVDAGTFRHLYFKFNYNTMTTVSGYVTQTGTNPPTNQNNNVVGYLTNNSPSTLVQVPEFDGLRMNAVFDTKGTSGLIAPLIENVSGAPITDFVFFNSSTNFSTSRVPYTTIPTGNFINADGNFSMFYGDNNYEIANALISHNGKMYRCTWWGYYGDGTHHIHMTMEVFN